MDVLQAYVKQVENRLEAAFPGLSRVPDEANQSGLYMIRDFQLPGQLFPRQLPLLFYSHYAVIAVLAASSFNYEFWSQNNLDPPMCPTRALAEVSAWGWPQQPTIALLRYSLDLRRTLDTLAMSGPTWLMGNTKTILVVVNRLPDNEKAIPVTYSYRLSNGWSHNLSDEHILCLMHADLSPPILAAPPGMMADWKFEASPLFRLGDLLKSYLQFTFDDETRVW